MNMSGGFRLVVRRGPQPSQVYELNLDMMTLGRDVNNEITVNDPEVSRHHCRLTRGPNGYTLEDLGSTNGTFVNGRRLTGAQMLNAGDLIGLGETVTLAYESGVGGAPPGGPGFGAAQQAPQPQQPQPYGGGYQQQPPPPEPQGYYNQPPGYQQGGYGPPAAQMGPYYENEARGNRSCGIFIGCGIFFILLLVGWIVAIIVIDTPLDDVRGINDAANAVPLPGSSVDNVESYLEALKDNCNVEEARNYVCSDADAFHSNPDNLLFLCGLASTLEEVSCSQDNNDVSCETGSESDDRLTVNVTNGRVCGFVFSVEEFSGFAAFGGAPPPTTGE